MLNLFKCMTLKSFFICNDKRNLVFKYDFYFLNEFSVIISFEAIIDETLNEYIIYIAKQIRNNPFSGFVEVSTAYASLTVFFKSRGDEGNFENLTAQEVESYLRQLISTIEVDNKSLDKERIIEVPTFYDGPDLESVSNFTGLSGDEIIFIHSSAVYRVYMVGFLPGFAYLGGMDERLSTPRREYPRAIVPAGSVGIAGEQTGIYPLQSPGGWQLIGRTDTKLFTPDKKEITLLKQGDLVKFVEIPL